MKYRAISAEDYKGEPIQFCGYYVLHVTQGMPKPEIFFVEVDEIKDKKGIT